MTAMMGFLEFSTTLTGCLSYWSETLGKAIWRGARGRGLWKSLFIHSLLVSAPGSEAKTGSGYTHLSGTESSMMLAHNRSHKCLHPKDHAVSVKDTAQQIHSYQKWGDHLFPKHLRVCGCVYYR